MRKSFLPAPIESVALLPGDPIEMSPRVEIDDLLGRVRIAIEAALSAGAPTIDGVARAVGMSIRTLQRRLWERNVSFSLLVRGVRESR